MSGYDEATASNEVKGWSMKLIMTLLPRTEPEGVLYCFNLNTIGQAKCVCVCVCLKLV